MKRTCKNNLNRNRSIFNRIRNNNLVTPEILVNQIWVGEEDSSGVKIIELKSSPESSQESTKSDAHPWSYINNDNYEDHNYNSINGEATFTRRVNTDYNKNFAAAYANQYFFDRSMQSTDSFSDNYDAEYDSIPISHQRNCFSIINKRHIESDTSTDNENYERVEVMELDKAEDTNHWDHVYKDVTYEPKQSEQRTIWIYSYKNRRLLSEHDYELVNIPSIDTSTDSTSCSISDEEKGDKNSIATRLGSPIPAAYIPKLDLSLVQTLSTVTEISEPNKSKESREVLNKLPKNNWLTERKDKVKKLESSNVVNWMALSPRERRRRSINTNSETIALQNIKETEITYAEGNKQEGSLKIESSTVQADTHVIKNETKEEIVEAPKNILKTDSKKITDILPMKISFADADNDVDEHITDLDYIKRPSIQIKGKLIKAEVTDPIENLNCDNWIVEEKMEKEASIYDYDIVEDANVTKSSSENVNTASRRLWMSQMQLTKAPQWSEYLPITCSPPSLHLSLSLGSLDSKKSWFKRLARCMKCCK